MKSGIACAAFAAGVLAASASVALDQSLPTYSTVNGIAGQLRSVGSDTLHSQMELWAKGFSENYPNVKIAVDGKGSATAPPALLDGTAQFGPMSRPMTSAETDAFEKKYGYPVSKLAVAVDALSVYVNKENPIKCLSMEQVDRIFSSKRKGSGGKSIDTWGDAGLSGGWANKPIAIYGRNDISGTYEFFREIALYDGEYKQEVKQQVGSEAVVENVAKDKFAIGYSGIGYRTEGVQPVQLAISAGRECSGPSAEEAYSGKYPIARYLYIYFNKKPNEPLDSVRGEFIRYILSREGQAQTEKGGYYPITHEIHESELKRLGLSALAK